MININLDVDGDTLPANLLKLTEKISGGDHDAGVRRTYKLTAPGGFKKLDWLDVCDGIRDQFLMRCYCEHDCCGHYFGGARRIRLRRGAVFFTTHYSRNV